MNILSDKMRLQMSRTFENMREVTSGTILLSSDWHILLTLYRREKELDRALSAIH
jgi:hypothetical protein